MSVDDAVAYFRQRQQDLFRDECVISRPFGSPIFDSNTGTYGQPTSVVYTGACLVRPQVQGERQAGEREVSVAGYLAKLPPDSDVERGDLFTVTASTYDAALVDREFTVTQVPPDGWQISRRVTLEDTE